MKLTTSVLILALTGSAFAQAPANKNTAPAAKPATVVAKPAANTKPVSATPAKPPMATTKSPMSAKPATTASKPMTKPVGKAATAPSAMKSAKTVAKAKKVEKAPVKAATPAAPADAAKPTEVAASAKNRRDPFLSIVVSREGPACAGSGKKCISISEVTLQGVVRSAGGPIAVVSSGANKTYFLRENDPVYNGVVVKISPDSIVFRETVMDRLGKSSQREVVKKIHNSPAA